MKFTDRRAPRPTTQGAQRREEEAMAEIEIGDKVEITGDTQSYILVDPDEVYTGEVIGKSEGEIVVRLDKPVVRGANSFREVSVREKNARRCGPAPRE
jgi:hypothetical protein